MFVQKFRTLLISTSTLSSLTISWGLGLISRVSKIEDKLVRKKSKPLYGINGFL